MTTSTQSQTSKKPHKKPFYLDGHDMGVAVYYNEDSINCTEVEMHMNGVLPKGRCQMKLREDNKAVFWKHAIYQGCFTKEHLMDVMKAAYSNNHHPVLAYNDVAKQIAKKI
jgi:hypothetical protein